jgi:hypothetical protein
MALNCALIAPQEPCALVAALVWFFFFAAPARDQSTRETQSSVKKKMGIEFCILRFIIASSFLVAVAF